MTAWLASLLLCLPAAAQRRPRIAAFMASPAPGADQVALRWLVQPGPGDRVSQYQLERDGEVIWTGRGDAYLDAGALPGKHVYQLRAFLYNGGIVSSREESVDVGGVCDQPPVMRLDPPAVSWPAEGYVVSMDVRGAFEQPSGCRRGAAVVQLVDDAGRARLWPVPVAGDRFGATLSVDVSPSAMKLDEKPVPRRFVLRAVGVNEVGPAGSNDVPVVVGPQKF